MLFFRIVDRPIHCSKINWLASYKRSQKGKVTAKMDVGDYLEKRRSLSSTRLNPFCSTHFNSKLRGSTTKFFPLSF